MKISVAISKWSNWGKTDPEWVDLPVEDIEADILKPLNIQTLEDCMICGYDSDTSIIDGLQPFDDLEELNELARALEGVKDIKEIYFMLDRNILKIYRLNKETVTRLYPDPWDAFEMGSCLDVSCLSEWLMIDDYNMVHALDEWQFESVLEEAAYDILKEFETQYCYL